MKITKVDTIAIRIPGQAYMGGHGTDMNAGTLGNYVRHTRYRSSYNLFTESLLVRFTTNDGLVGWGEPQSALVAHIVGQIVREPATVGTTPDSWSTQSQPVTSRCGTSWDKLLANPCGNS